MFLRGAGSRVSLADISVEEGFDLSLVSALAELPCFELGNVFEHGLSNSETKEELLACLLENDGKTKAGAEEMNFAKKL